MGLKKKTEAKRLRRDPLPSHPMTRQKAAMCLVIAGMGPIAQADRIVVAKAKWILAGADPFRVLTEGRRGR